MGQDGWHLPCSFQLGYPRHCLSCVFSNPQCNPLFPYTHVCFLHPSQKVLDCASMAVLHRNHDRPWAPPVACVEVSPNKPSQDEQTRNCTECPRHGLRVTPIHIHKNSVLQYLLHSFSNDFQHHICFFSLSGIYPGNHKCYLLSQVFCNKCCSWFIHGSDDHVPAGHFVAHGV